MYTNSGCTRLIDYYFVVSCDDYGIVHIKKKLQHKSLASEQETTARYAQFALKPKIIDRYPTTNHIDTPLMSWIAPTSMPRGIRARTRPPAPIFFTFVGWNIDTSKLYGACLMVFEKINIPNQLQTVYIPKTLGFLSHYPYFYAFNVFLRCLWHIIPKKLIPLENLLIHYFYDIAPPEPKNKIAYDLGETKVIFACRNEFDVPILELAMENAFTQLSKDRICFIMKLLLLEKRLIFISSDIYQLTPICELFVSLLFPLSWKHLYMPLLSRTMFQAILSKYNKYDESHTPFIIGLPRFVYLSKEIENHMPINSYLVFVDRNEITDYKKQVIHPNHMKSHVIVPLLLQNTLRDAIHALSRILTIQTDDIQNNNSYNTNTKVNLFISREYTVEAFRTMFAVITKLLRFSLNHNNNHPFIIKFRMTQLFKSFIKYYKRINGKNDPDFNNINEFYQANEAHGKHFARRQINSWHYNNNTFDIKLYDTPICKISTRKINILEANNTKFKNINKISMKSRSKKFVYPIKEFEMLSQVKQFLTIYVWKVSKTTTTTTSSRMFLDKPRVHQPKYLKVNKIRHNSYKDYDHEQNVSVKGCCVIFPISFKVSQNKELHPILYKNCSRSISKSKSKSLVDKKKKYSKSYRHILNKSISLNVTGTALQTKVEKFCTELTNHKDNMEISLNLCVGIERKIQRNISKYRNETNWKCKIYDIFKQDIEARNNFVRIIGKLCVEYGEYKSELQLLQSVVDMFNEELSLVSVGDEYKYKYENSDSSDDETENESDGESESSGTWPVDSNDDDFYDEIDNFRGCKFTKLDEFTLDKMEIEWFDKCEILQRDSLGVDGIKYVDNLINNGGVIGEDFIEDFIVEQWRNR